MWNNEFTWLKDETVVYETGIHKIVFLQVIFFVVFLFLVIALLYFTVFMPLEIDQMAFKGFLGIELLFVVIQLVISIPQYMLWKKSYLIVTNQRIIYRIGWIHQNVGEILLSRLIGINVEQGFQGRILNYGTIKFNGDNDILQPLTLIKNPFELKDQVLRQIHREKTSA
jgi:membrane protein YdbS with pleckstrin-like domain